MKQLILILLITQMSFAQIAVDKQKHFVAGAFFGSIGYSIAYGETKNKKKAFLFGVLSSVLAGLGKELLDEHNYRGFSSRDLMATTLGGVAVCVVIELINK
jgi:uncharacterized protein YfiM (DUF2279 family)